MNEEDQKIREMLSGFRPDAEKSEVDFMARLQQKMDTVDTVKDYCRTEKRRNRRAVIIAAIAGVLTGVGLTLATPYLGRFFGEALGAIIPWAIVALGVLTAIFLAYFLSITFNDDLSPKQSESSPIISQITERNSAKLPN